MYNYTVWGRGGFCYIFVQFGADFPENRADFPASGENVRRTKGARLGQRVAVFVTF